MEDIAGEASMLDRALIGVERIGDARRLGRFLNTPSDQ
jgi:hypothetical protein